MPRCPVRTVEGNATSCTAVMPSRNTGSGLTARAAAARALLELVYYGLRDGRIRKLVAFATSFRLRPTNRLFTIEGVVGV